jgi:hypothetical protein
MSYTPLGRQVPRIVSAAQKRQKVQAKRPHKQNLGSVISQIHNPALNMTNAMDASQMATKSMKKSVDLMSKKSSDLLAAKMGGSSHAASSHVAGAEYPEEAHPPHAHHHQSPTCCEQLARRMNRAVMRFVFAYYIYCAWHLYHYQSALRKGGQHLVGRLAWAPALKWVRYWRECGEKLDDEARKSARKGLIAFVQLALFRQAQRQCLGLKKSATESNLLQLIEKKYSRVPSVQNLRMLVMAQQ